MRSLPRLQDEHIASGYASDDDCRPKPLPRGYGALPGDEPARRRLSEQEVLEYGIRQASAGPPGRKVRFLDALLAARSGCRPSPAQTRPRTAFERHCALLRWLPSRSGQAGAPALKTDLTLLRESHRFLRSDEDDDGSWEARLARRYYDRLFKEYVICDLAGYRKGNVGFRWRTEAEVLQGRGQFQCGHRGCEASRGLRSYEVDFKYVEAGKRKRVLVKARLCEPCAYKLHYRRLKAERKRRRRSAERARKRAKKEGGSLGLVSVDASDGSAGDGSSDDALRGGAESEAAAHGSDGDGGAAPPSSQQAAEADGQPSEDEKRRLESLAWRGPDPEARTREDDFDEYLNSLLV